MASCTIFSKFTIPKENKSLLLIGKDIISDKYKTEVEEIRKLIAQGNKPEADNKKKQLLAFTPSAVFKEKRQMPFLEMYSGFVHLDFDKLSSEELKTAFEIICKISYTSLCFLSPSGNGLKVFVEVNTGLEHHDIAYLQVQKHYEDATALKADPSCKDVTRLCFMSHDPNAYRNIQNEKFIVALPQFIQEQQKQTPSAIAPVIEKPQAEPEDLNTDFIFNQQVQFTNQKASYTNGNRNNYIYLLASNCNRAGLSQSDTEILCTQHFDLSEGEIKTAVNSAYSLHTTEFAQFANSAKLQTAKQLEPKADEDPLEDYLKTTPTIPDEVFESLPHIFKEGARAFTDKRKRDVFFTGAISILSGCLPKVTGIYFNERVFPHLFTFIIAPAASGKGVLKNAKRLADKYHQQLLKQSQDAKRIHETEMCDYKQLERTRKKGEQMPEKPQPPPFKIVFIPADCSQARMVEHLQANEGKGIICETEADTMSGAKKQDWGDYSPILRSAFHHEKISISRKTGNEYVEINDPCLAVALSGTPSQAPKLIASAEDGLFSRFLFYAYKNNIEWQDPSPSSNTIVYNDHFNALSNQVLDLISLLEKYPTTIELTPSQWAVINSEFPKMLAEVVTFTSEDAAGVVFRLGLILYRICMILSALRKFENGEATEVIICTDTDFNTALLIIQTYLHHSLLMFNNLPKQNETMQFHSGDSKKKFFEALPEEFTRKQAIEIGANFKLSNRTVDDILKSCLGISLAKLKAGTYNRI